MVSGFHSITGDLRRRERTTAAMVAAINEKIARLTAARDDRVKALQQIRSAISRAVLAGQGVPEDHEHR
jgi:hypothetical protein